MFSGYAAVSDTIDASIIIYFFGFAFLFATLYTIAQIYQYEEDKKK